MLKVSATTIVDFVHIGACTIILISFHLFYFCSIKL